MRTRYREQKYNCGNYLEINMYPVFEYPKSNRRKKKRKPTSKIQEKLNQINAERNLTRLINHNFTNKDIKVELTYNNKYLPDSVEQAQKDIQNFIRRLKRYRSKLGLGELKYIYSIEQGSKKGRIHFHVILTGGVDITEIAKLWGKGYVDKILPLMFNQTGCVGIAKYFCKQQITGKRWVPSRNCIKPQPTTNDFKLTKRRVTEFARDSENRRLFENLYPDYYYAECTPFYNEDNGFYYLTLLMYKKSTKLDL